MKRIGKLQGRYLCFIELGKYFLYLQILNCELGIEGRKRYHIRPHPPRVGEIDVVVGTGSLIVLNRRTGEQMSSLEPPPEEEGDSH